MAERLTPPKGPWKKKPGQFGPQFEHDAGTDPTTGIRTTWEKSVSQNAEIVTRFNTHPNGTLDRWVMDSINATGRHILYTVRDKGERNQYFQLGYAEGEFQSLSVSTDLDEAKRPAFLNVKNVSAIYALDGALTSMRVQVDSQSHFSEEEYWARSMEDNLRELIQIFKSSGEKANSPFVPDPNQQEGERTMVDIHEAFVGQWVRGKLIQWTDAEKERIDEDLAIITQAIVPLAEDAMTPEQMGAMSNFLITETVKTLPDDYPKLEGEEREGAFDQAFEEAMLQCFKFHNHSLQTLAQHTIIFATNPLEAGKYVFAVFQGHPMNPFSDEEETKPLAGQIAEVGYGYHYEDKQYGLMRQEDYLAVLISSKFNKDKKVLYLAPERLPMDELLPVIKTDHPAEWMRTYEVAKIGLEVIPA